MFSRALTVCTILLLVRTTVQNPVPSWPPIYGKPSVTLTCNRPQAFPGILVYYSPSKIVTVKADCEKDIDVFLSNTPVSFVPEEEEGEPETVVALPPEEAPIVVVEEEEEEQPPAVVVAEEEEPSVVVEEQPVAVEAEEQPVAVEAEEEPVGVVEEPPVVVVAEEEEQPPAVVVAEGEEEEPTVAESDKPTAVEGVVVEEPTVYQDSPVVVSESKDTTIINAPQTIYNVQNTGDNAGAVNSAVVKDQSKNSNTEINSGGDSVLVNDESRSQTGISNSGAGIEQ